MLNNPRLLSVRPLNAVPLPFCADTASAYRHLCDHLLTRPEAEFWCALLPIYRSFLDPEDDNALFAYAKSLWSRGYAGDHVDGEQELYNQYADTTQLALGQAIAQGWFWEEEDPRGKREWHGFGKCGIYVIWEQTVVRTSMLKAFAAPPPELELSEEERKHNPLPRQNTWKRSSADVRENEDPYPRVPADNVCYFLFLRCRRSLKRAYRNAVRESERRVDGKPVGDRRVVTPINANLWHCELADWQAIGCSVGRPGCHVAVEEGELV
jgi:hypothetical protein